MKYYNENPQVTYWREKYEREVDEYNHMVNDYNKNVDDYNKFEEKVL